MSTFTIVNESTLVHAIERTQTRLVYIAPGVTAPIVAAFERLMQRADAPALTVIVDTDPEVCRLGYGTVEGLQALQQAATTQMLPVRYQPGLRIGVLVVDDEIAVYSPTPLLIEAGAERDDQPNAIVLGSNDPLDPVERLLYACAAEGADGTDVPLPNEAEIGSQVATPAVIQAAVTDLARLPPKPFDVARTERVYSSKLQYVDFEVTGYRLATRRAQLPTDLLVGNDNTLEARLRNSFSLLEGATALTVEIPDIDPDTGQPRYDATGQPKKVSYSEQMIEKDRRKIYEDFLTAIPNHGQLINKMRRPAFDTRVDWFKGRIAAYQDAVRARLDQAVQKSVEELTEALLPGVMQRPPARLMKNLLSMSPTAQEMRDVIRHELQKTLNFGEGFFQPSVKVVFKDLTYETIKDDKFREQVDKSFKGLTPQSMRSLFDEHDAAPELALIHRATGVS